MINIFNKITSFFNAWNVPVSTVPKEPRTRQAVIKAVQKGNQWELDLACGAKVSKPVREYMPYLGSGVFGHPEIITPKFVLCPCAKCREEYLNGTGS